MSKLRLYPASSADIVRYFGYTERQYSYCVSEMFWTRQRDMKDTEF